jgi:uncharacterized protein YndB with AHSA1/START domain/mannose-6-phosphate isomerase-like protein (cupin superfamily)
MATAGDVLEMGPLGIRVEFLRSSQETDGELVETEISGHPRGFLDQRHVHERQIERIEVVSGAMKVAMHGVEHVLTEGESIEIPAGTPHRQVPIGKGAGTVRIQVRPAGHTEAFLERLAKLCGDGQITRLGFPRPVAAAELMLDFSDAGHAATPPVSLQRAIAGAVMAVARPMRPYLFIDEWDVAAPPAAVFDAIADSRTYPDWWRPVYLDVEANGPPELGKEARHHFKGRLPYHLHTRSVCSAFDPPRTITADVDGDLRGRGTWTLTPIRQGTHVRFDWQVHADRKLLRMLTPVLRPIFRWNHNWAIARAIEGLEPYAQRGAAAASTGHESLSAR